MTPNAKDREDLVRRLQTALINRVKVEQSQLYLRISNLVTGLDADDAGRIKNSNANLRAQTKITSTFNTFQRKARTNIVKWLLRGVSRLLGLNALHFKGINPLREGTIKQKALQRLLLRLGFGDGKITPGGWLDGLTAANEVKLNILRRFSSAVLGGVGKKVFQKSLADDLIGKNGLVEKFYQKNAGTLFISVDREVQNLYREELKLDHALYSGTIKNNTRPFCRARVGRIYTVEEVNKWNSLDWKGKIPGADTKSVAGGFRCRHSFNWITKEAAERIAKRRGIEINTYN